MEPKRKRLTLDLAPAFQRRLKAIAALKGVSMRWYCQAAIDRELARDEANEWPAYCLTNLTMSLIRTTPAGDHFGGKPLPGSSVDLIR